MCKSINGYDQGLDWYSKSDIKFIFHIELYVLDVSMERSELSKKESRGSNTGTCKQQCLPFHILKYMEK